MTVRVKHIRVGTVQEIKGYTGVRMPKALPAVAGLYYINIDCYVGSRRALLWFDMSEGL